ncbi:MAG TPA: (d)CMP kinase [Acholeplasmataceae bacterium]|nr:(d)CMP kinase [Acholeplasmataceae bacterium]
MSWQIAIDGPAGAGKSTIAKMLASKLGFDYLDTGAMYRAVTLKALQLKINLENEEEYKFLDSTQIDFVENKIFLDGKDVSKEIRSIDVTNNVSLVSKFQYVRDTLVAWQRKLASNKNIIMDGRDIGTVVLPNANLKIFLSATVEERARRRYQEMLSKGNENISLENTIKEISKRDKQDSNRDISPLLKAEDAIEIDTSNLSVDEVVDKIISIVMERGYKMENVKTENEKIVETNVVEEAAAEETTAEEIAEDVEVSEEVDEVSDADFDEDQNEADEEDEEKEIKPLRPMQLVEGTITEIYQAKKQVIDKEGKVVRKAKDQRLLLRLENGQEGLLFRKDVANVKEDEDLADLFMEGDKLQVIVKRVYPDGGRVLLSTILVEKRNRIKKFEEVIANHGYFTAKVIKAIKAGLILQYEDFTCLLPHTQIRVEPEEYDSLVGQEIIVAPIRVDYNRIRLIVSHTVATAIKNKENKEKFISTVKVGQEFEGVVKNIESYGAFVEISEGVEGLLHISEISHDRIVKVEKVLNVGDKVKVKVIKVEGDHIGLSRKALLPNHWKDFMDTHNIGDVISGEVIEINRAGVVLSLNEHVQGFLPKSEFTWERDTFIEDYIKLGDQVEAKIIELDLNKKRIILSRKQLTENPWETLNLKSGDKVTASVIKVLNDGVKVSVEGAAGFLPKGNFGKANESDFVEGSEFEAKVRMFDPRRTKLILTLRENAPLDKRTINKYLKQQEKVTSTFGDFLESFKE